MDEVNKHRIEWRFKQKIANAITEIGGTVFGGFVRDSILHDYYAKEFYKKLAEDGILLDEVDRIYNDPSVYPETKDRMVIPNDIDCYLETEEMIVELLQKFRELNLSYRCVFDREDISRYIPRLAPMAGSLKHIRYKVYLYGIEKKKKLIGTLLTHVAPEFRDIIKSSVYLFAYDLYRKALTLPYVNIDVLVKTTPSTVEAPFGNIDFECNALLMNSDGIRLSNQLYIRNSGMAPAVSRTLKMASIIEDIVAKRAVIVRSGDVVDAFRLQKMKEKQWEIVANFNTIQSGEISRETGNTSEPEICIICHDPLLEQIHTTEPLRVSVNWADHVDEDGSQRSTDDREEEQKYYKLPCCAAKYHRRCLLQCITTGTSAIERTNRCIMCNRRVPNMDADKWILENYHI